MIFQLVNFYVSKLFSSKCYFDNNDDQTLDDKPKTRHVITKSTILKVSSGLCRVKLLEFSKTLRSECENKGLFES